MNYSTTITAAYPTRVKRRGSGDSTVLAAVVAVTAFMLLSIIASSTVYIGRADNFTDIFYTNSFRGAFTWIQKLDWVGLVVQCVISCFSLFGVALMTIRIMTSMLYLSSKGLWEEVHDLKQSGGEGDLFDFGLVNMAKSWAKGKAGTGLDAVMGAVLILLPDVKKYSDFGEKASGDFDSNMSISQYMLKIALPTIMTVFFFAMGFNGTLFQALAVTVDAMGTAADKAISVNYAGFVEDLVNSGTGYQFYFNASGTNLGRYQQNIAKDIYGRLVSEIHGADAEQLYALGHNVEIWVANNITTANLATGQVSETVRNGLSGETDSDPDQYVNYMGYELIINGSTAATGELGESGLNIFETFFAGGGDMSAVPRIDNAYTSQQAKYLHVFLKQTSNFNGSYFNMDGVNRNE